MHHARAARAEPAQAAELGSVGPEFHLVKCRASGLLAAQAKKPAGPARTLPCAGPPAEKINQVHAADDRRVAVTHRLKTGLEPMADRAGGRAGYLGGFTDIVGAQPLDALG